MPQRTVNYANSTFSSAKQIPSVQIHKLDEQYSQLRVKIRSSPQYSTLSKHLIIRVNSWLGYLDETLGNRVWKINRNHYAQLMKVMLDQGVIRSPFIHLPPEKDLPKMSKCEMQRIVEAIQKQGKQRNKENEKHNDLKHGRKQSGKLKSSLNYIEDESSYLQKFLEIADTSNLNLKEKLSKGLKNTFGTELSKSSSCRPLEEFFAEPACKPAPKCHYFQSNIRVPPQHSLPWTQNSRDDSLDDSQQEIESEVTECSEEITEEEREIVERGISLLEKYGLTLEPLDEQWVLQQNVKTRRVGMGQVRTAGKQQEIWRGIKQRQQVQKGGQQQDCMIGCTGR